MYKLPSLAMHRTASHFVQQLLDYSEPENQQLIVQKLLEAPLPESFVEVAFRLGRTKTRKKPEMQNIGGKQAKGEAPHPILLLAHFDGIFCLLDFDHVECFHIRG